MSEIYDRPRSGKRGEWLRSPWARALIAAALMVSLLLDGAFLSVGRLHSSPAGSLDHPADPVTDDQSEAQVVGPARQIVTVARLQKPTAGYLLMSCKNRDDPPYQGAIYMNFALPAEARDDTYFRNIAAAMVAHGWSEGLPPNQQLYGRTLHKDGVTAIVFRNSDDANVGIMRLYGQCRNVNDHRNDTTAWIDITDRFNRTR
jgi:hypothetical protein